MDTGQRMWPQLASFTPAYRLANRARQKGDTLLSGRIRWSPRAGEEIWGVGSCRARAKKSVTPCLRRSFNRAQTQNSCGLERETGLEPAAPCLEGRYLHFHRLEAANPFESSTSHRSTVYGRKHGSCQSFLRPPATACAQITTEEAM